MIAWSRQLIDDHCSSWTIIQTLEWFNVIDIQWIRLKQSWKLSSVKAPALLSERTTANEAADVRAHIMDVNVALGESRRWLRDEPLRYCPACVQSGMHYRYQQDRKFRRCILHQRNLKTGCPRCGAAMDTRGSGMHGFICNSCGGTLLRNSVPGPMGASRKPSKARLLDELDRCETVATASTCEYQRAATGSSPPLWHGQGRDTDATLFWHALAHRPNARIQSALEPLPTSFRTFPTSSLSAPLLAQPHHQQQADAIQPYRDLLRCVSRRLRRTYLRGHAACRVHATRSVGSSSNRIQRPVTLKPHLCCVAQAYALWLLQRRIELHQIDGQLERGLYAPGKLPIRLPDLKSTALSYVSSFEAWVQTLARLQRLVRRSDRQSLLYDGVSTSPHWALLQPGATRSCPVHLRIDWLGDVGQCDKGRVLQDEREMVAAMGARRHRLRDKMRSKPNEKRSRASRCDAAGTS